MLKNYFKISYRNLVHNKGLSIINIVGLSIGMTCCLLIFQYVAFEYSFDNFHNNKENLYRALQSFAHKGEELSVGDAYTAQGLAPALKDAVPEIAEITRVHPEDAVLFDAAHPEKVFEDDHIIYADPGFMTMFSFPLVSGDRAKKLTSGTAFISESAAQKYFGTSNPEGRTMEITGIIRKAFTISGVFQDVPANSHLRFDVVLPMDDLLRSEEYANEPEGGWSWNNFATYVQLHPGADRQAVAKRMTDIYLKYRGEFIAQQGGIAAMNIQPISDIHLNSEIDGPGNIVAGSYRTVHFFLIIGLVTLVIALVNYVNLATARAVNRSREVGVRKVAGAKRAQLVVQFLCESGLTNLSAAIMSLAFAAALIPFVNDIAETQLSIAMWATQEFWLVFVAGIMTGTLLAGLYPAFVLSSFRPASVLKGRDGYVSGHSWLRKSLVVVQFAASIMLLAGTATVYSQLNFMRNIDLGLNINQVLTMRAPRVLPENTDRATVMQTFKQQLANIPGIQQSALSSSIPGAGFNWNGAAIRKATDDPSAAIRGVATYVDSTFANLYGLKLLVGKEFKDITLSQDKDAPWNVILNETAVASLAFSSPAEAVDQMIDIGGYRAQIIGVYKDFNWSSAHQARQNIVFGQTTRGSHISVRLATTETASVIAQIQKLYQTLFPGNVFTYAFADEAFDLQYQNDQRFAKLFSIAAGMTIFIACMGLFGLVAFTAQQRIKEIGVRKVLGATVTDIVGLLSKDFLKLVVIGLILAVPVTWYVMNEWLQNFAYRTNVNFFTLLVSGSLAIMIALLTVSWQSFKAAIANPVDSLRNE
jgi:putative ABC transport system permease protein